MNLKSILILFSFFMFLVYIKNIYTQKHFVDMAGRIPNEINSVFYYANAVRAYAPLSPYTDIALSKLMSVYKYEIDRKDLLKALYTLEMEKSSLLAIRSFYQPYKKELENIEKQICLLRKQIKHSNMLNTIMPIKINYRLYQPNSFFALGAVLFFLLWVISIFKLLSVDSFDVLETGKAFFYVGISLIFWLMWVFFLELA